MLGSYWSLGITTTTNSPALPLKQPLRYKGVGITAVLDAVFTLQLAPGMLFYLHSSVRLRRPTASLEMVDPLFCWY